jgi:hypothetical protein
MSTFDLQSRLDTVLKRPLYHSLLVVLFFTTLFVVFFSPSILRGAPLAVGADGQNLYFPNFLGRKVFWDHMIFAGFPMMADPQAMTWYPPALLLSLIPGSWNLLILLAYVLAASFIYGYILTVTESRLAGLIGGTILGLSGFMMAHLGHVVVIHSVAWIPLLLWSYEKLRRKWHVGWFVAGSAAIGMSFLGGHTPIFTLGFGLATSYAIVLGWSAPVGRWRYYTTCALLIVLGISLVAVQIVLTAEIAGQSIRAGYKFSDFISHALPPRQIGMLIFPKLFGGLKESGALPYYGAENLTELTGYVGLLPLLLAVVGVIKWPQRALAIFWFAVALIAVPLAMGDATPLARLLYHVPIVNQFRAPGRHLLEFTFAVCVLAGLGTATIVRKQVTSSLVFKVVVVSGVLLIAVAVITFINLDSLYALAAHKDLAPEQVWRWTRRAVGIPLGLFVASALLLISWARAPKSLPRIAFLFVILIVDLGSFGWSYDWHYVGIDKAELNPKEIATRYQKILERDNQRILPIRGTMAPTSELPPNLSGLWGVPSASGYNSLVLSRYSQLLNMLDVGKITRPTWWDPNDQSLNVAAVRYLFMPEMSVATDRFGTTWQDDELQLWMGAGCNYTSIDSVTFHPTDAPASTAIGIVSRLACGVSIPDGTEFAQLRIVDLGNSVETHSLLAGRDASDWAYDCKTVENQLKHKRAEVFENFDAKVYDESCQGHFYRSIFKLANRKNVKSIELRWTGPVGSLILDKVSLIDDQLHTSAPVDPMTMGEAWRFVEEKDGARVFENLSAMPRVWLAPEVIVVGADEARRAIQLSKLTNGRRFDPKQMALVEEPLEMDVGKTAAASAELVSLTDNAMAVRTASTTPVFLVTSDVYYPGWHATIDDQPAKLYRADYAFRGVAVPAGQHLVKFKYRPSRFYLGAGVSLTSLLILCALPLASLIKRRGRRP